MPDFALKSAEFKIGLAILAKSKNDLRYVSPGISAFLEAWQLFNNCQPMYQFEYMNGVTNVASMQEPVCSHEYSSLWGTRTPRQQVFLVF